MLNILITGSKGQLGTELGRVIECGHSEIGDLPAFTENITLHGVDFDEMDISDAASAARFTSAVRPDIIINCAAMTNVDGCESDRDKAFRVNALGARNMAILAEKYKAKLIHISTDYVFNGSGTKPYCEWDICSPQSVYGFSKYLGEQYVREFCSRYFIVRTSWLYGYTGANFVKTIMKAAGEKGKLTVVNDQRGNPTNAADLAHHLLEIAQTEEYGIYHCTGSGECSWFDFASKIVEYAGIPCEIAPCTTDELARPAKRPAYSSLEHMMLRATVGDKMREWNDALRCFIKNYSGG